MSGPSFTVFTPTFNRAHTLHRPHESLRKQTCRDFEWVVVDDGSTDGTADLLRRWQGEAAFPMRVFRQPNRGKHVAMNRGVHEAHGRFVLALDSDDGCVPEALDRLLGHWEAIPDDVRDRFSGVVGRCVTPDGHPVGRPLPAPRMDVSPLELRYRWGVTSEMWGFTRIELMRAVPFPETPERTYLPESLVWDRIATTHLARFVDEPLRIYWLEAGPSSLGTPGDPAKAAYGNMEQHRMVIEEQLGWFRLAPLAFVRSAAYYSRFSLHAGVGISDQRRRLDGAAARLLWLAALPVGWALHAVDRLRRAR